jgi:hypothetical protein
MEFETELEKYSKSTVKVGLNIQKDSLFGFHRLQVKKNLSVTL